MHSGAHLHLVSRNSPVDWFLAAKFCELLGLGGRIEKLLTVFFGGIDHPCRRDTVRISRSADPASHWTDEDPERDSDLCKVTQQVRGRTGTRTQDSRLSVWSFPGCFQHQKQHLLGKVLLAKLSGVGFALSHLATVDFLTLKYSLWESQLLFISFQMEC